jgi:hypothetical protein
MIWKLSLWDRFLDPSFWLMHAIVLVWLVFTIVFFVAEPLFLHRWFERAARARSQQTFRLIHRFHWLLLSVSLVTAFAAVAGSHGITL